MYELPNKPQEIGAIINNGTRLLTAGIKQAAIILLIMLVLNLVLSSLFGPGLVKIYKQIVAGQANIRYDELLLLSLPFIIVVLIINNAMIASYSALANSRQLSLAEALWIGIRKLLAVLAYLFLYNLIVGIATLPVFILIALFQSQPVLAAFFGLAASIPLAIIALSLYFGNYLIVADDAGVIESLFRSQKLVRGNLRRAAIYILLITLIQLFSMLTQIFFILSLPVVVAFILPFIHDLKLRQGNSGHFAA